VQGGIHRPCLHMQSDAIGRDQLRCVHAQQRTPATTRPRPPSG
jgi:hypothetical protein